MPLRTYDRRLAKEQNKYGTRLEQLRKLGQVVAVTDNFNQQWWLTRIHAEAELPYAQANRSVGALSVLRRPVDLSVVYRGKAEIPAVPAPSELAVHLNEAMEIVAALMESRASLAEGPQLLFSTAEVTKRGVYTVPVRPSLRREKENTDDVLQLLDEHRTGLAQFLPWFVMDANPALMKE